MKTNDMIILGVIPLLLLVVFFSGCTTSQNERMIFEYTFNHTSDGNLPDFDVLNVTLPSGTNKVRIEYQNISAGPYINTFSGQGYSDLEVMLLNTVLPEGQLNNVQGVVIDVKRVQIQNNTLSGSLNFTNPSGKSLRIRGGNIIGTIKVYVS